MDGLVRLAAARALWWHWHRELAPGGVGRFPSVCAAFHPVRVHIGCRMDWHGGVSLDFSDRTICPTLVLVGSRILDHQLPVEPIPNFADSSAPRGDSDIRHWRNAFQYDL